MKKTSSMAILVVLVFWGTSVLAQDTASTMNPNAAYPRGMSPLVTKEKIDKSMQILIEIGLLYKMLGQPTMVSSDGGVIVAYGNTLRKYDKDLNMVKEVQLDVDADAMQELSSQLANKYSSKIIDLMGGMAGSPSASSNASSDASTSAVASGSNKSAEDQHEEEIKKEIDQIK